MDSKIKVQIGFNTAVEYLQLERENLLMLDKDSSEVMEIKFGDILGVEKSGEQGVTLNLFMKER
jgi:hypothetical protein